MSKKREDTMGRPIRKCNNTIDDIEPNGRETKFIFFGCWNNINCDSEYMYRDIVLDYIANNETDVKQLYIAGDNWYTNTKIVKEKKLKLYITEILRTGYDKLYGMGKDIYIAVGNHDIDSNITVDKKHENTHNPTKASSPMSVSNAKSANSANSSNSTSNPSSTSKETRDELKKDCNINTQKYYLKQIKKGSKAFEYPTLELLQNIKDIELSEATLCEQGIYIYVENIGVRYNKNSIFIIINTNKFDNFDEGLQYISDIENVINEVKEVNEVIRGQKSESSKQIFVMGHIPLFTNKKNKLSIHEINKKDHKFRKITYMLFDILTKHKIIYLCADTHNFSIMKITHNGKVLIQITAGTGGADPDLIDDTIKIPITKKFIDENEKDKEYDITAYSINSYGYASINIGASNINVCYTQVIKAPHTEELRISAPLYTSVQKITYKIMKKYPYLSYKSTIQEISYSNYGTIYNTKDDNGICKKIKDDPKGYVTGKEGKLFCYKKKIKKISNK
jgi:hypothetical protein